LVPEIGLTPQTEARFKSRFGNHIAVVHSALSDRQRWLAWEAARKQQVQVIIGTRSALFVPFAQLGLIIVDEEHDVSFKQQEGFRYHARDLAIYRAQLEKAPVVLGSATPSLESLRNVQQKRYQLLALPERAGAATMPTMRSIDLRRQILDEGLSPPLLNAMRSHLKQGGQVLLFLNRRGFAPTLMCHACGFVAHCKRCDAHYTLHKKINRLRCHHCTSEMSVPSVCPQCHANSWLSLGQGTERIETALQRHFPDHAIARIDRDTSRGRDAMAKWHEAIRAGRYQILLGTQMLAKGHDFPNVTLSALLDVDSALFATDFRAPERLAQLVTQVAGRAGRGSKVGEVLLQTHQPEHPLMQALLNGGYDPWSQAALGDREAHGLPPYQNHLLLRAEAGKADAAQALLRRFKQNLAADSRLAVFGPIPAPMAMRAGRYRFQLLLESNERRLAPQMLAPLLREAEKWPEARTARWSVDVDPLDMM
jgi:primosomal protein N' (replication factor Y)